MIENLHDERYQLENKQAWGAKLPANIKWELGRRGRKMIKNLFESTWMTE